MRQRPLGIATCGTKMIGKLVISQLAPCLGNLGHLGFKLQTSRKFGSKFGTPIFAASVVKYIYRRTEGEVQADAQPSQWGRNSWTKVEELKIRRQRSPTTYPLLAGMLFGHLVVVR